MVSVLPMTSQKTENIYPFEMFLSQNTANLSKNSKVKADQMKNHPSCLCEHFTIYSNWLLM